MKNLIYATYAETIFVRVSKDITICFDLDFSIGRLEMIPTILKIDWKLLIERILSNDLSGEFN